MIVSPEKETALRERMEQLGVLESNLLETFIRLSGPGGQKVNKTSSCVYLVHLPTGLSVKCQKERSQAMNHFLARRILNLASSLEALKCGTRIVAKIPRIMTPIRISIKVNPLCLSGLLNIAPFFKYLDKTGINDR